MQGGRIVLQPKARKSREFTILRPARHSAGRAADNTDRMSDSNMIYVPIALVLGEQFLAVHLRLERPSRTWDHLFASAEGL
jgi:hypothetical protein